MRHRVRARVRNALPITFVVYVSGIVASAVPTWVGVSFQDLRALPALRGFDFLDAARDALDAGAAALLTVAGVAVITWMISPWLAGAWLAASSGVQSIGGCFRLAWTRLPALLGASALFYVGLAILIALGFGLASVTYALFSDHPNARSTDLAVVISVAPIAFLGFVASAWHDVARAATLDGLPSLHAAKHAIRCLHPSDLLLYLGATGAITGIAFVVLTVAWGAPGWWAVAVTQPCLLSRAIIRSAWLTRAVDAQRRSRSA